MTGKRNAPNWLDVVPVVKEKIGTIVHDDGLISILIPRFNQAWMAKLFLPKNKKNEIRVNFEANGTAVWKQIDGQKTVREILQSLAKTGEGQEKYNDRVILFLQNLYNSGFIVVKK